MSFIYLFRYLKPYIGLVLATIFFLILSRIFSALDPVWLKKIIDGITQGFSWAGLSLVVATYFGLKVGATIFEYLRDVIFAPAEMGIAKTLSERLFVHLTNLPLSYHVDQKIGGLSRKITRGGRAVTFILDFLVINILPTIAGLFITTFLLLKLYPVQYAVIIFSTVVLYTAFTLWSTEKRQKFRVAAISADDDVASVEVDALTNIETVKYFNNEPVMLGRYQPAIQSRYQFSLASNRLFALITSGQSAILLIGLGSVLLLAIRQAQAGIMTVGDLVLLTTYIVQLSAPIDVLGFIYRQIKDGIADLDGMAKILQQDVTITEPENPVTLEKPKGGIQFQKVGFGYKGRPDVLTDISLTIKPGQRIAFVGPSGVGKSTIVKMLFRLYEPVSGQILIDGVPLSELSKESRRNIFAIVPQDPALFNASIADNIRFGKPDATDKEVEAAAKAASIHDAIIGFPEGYSTVVGERGVKLSGGEKQRVAIARAIVRNPKILVFDEATSSLDSHSEREIQTALDGVAKGRTTVAVAHRLSTIANSDQIYVLNAGGIAEAGTHSELLAKHGLYAKLWKLQASGKDPELQPAAE